MKKFIFAFCMALSATSFATQQLTLMLNAAPNPNHAPLIVAQQQGYFKEEGLDVRFVVPKQGKNISAQFTARQADLGVVYEPDYIKWVDQGRSFIQVGTLIDKPLDCLIALKSSHIKTVADLKGKRIGSLAASMDQPLLRSMLQKAGLTLHDVKWVNLKESPRAALLSHQVDAVASVLRNADVLQLEAKHHAVVAFFPEEHGVPNYSELIFIAPIKESNDPRIGHFLSAVKKAVRYLDENPQQAWHLFAARYPASNTPLNHEMWLMTLSYFAEEPASVNVKEWKQFAEFMRKNDLIKNTQPTTRYAALMYAFAA